VRLAPVLLPTGTQRLAATLQMAREIELDWNLIRSAESIFLLNRFKSVIRSSAKQAFSPDFEHTLNVYKFHHIVLQW